MEQRKYHHILIIVGKILSSAFGSEAEEVTILCLRLVSRTLWMAKFKAFETFSQLKALNTVLRVTKVCQKWLANAIHFLPSGAPGLSD